MRLVFYPDPILTRPAASVVTIDEALRERAEAMVPFMSMEGGIGLAAPQVGWGVRLLIADPSEEGRQPRVLINPEIVWKGGGTEWGEEGCLSFPGIYGEVLRAQRVRVKATGLDGQEFLEEAEDLYARVLQHEIDHLDGILFVTRMRPADKALNKTKLADLARRFSEGEAVPTDVPR